MSDGHAEESAPPPAVRATDADRDDVVAKLKQALNAGALEFEEIETRIEAVYTARTKRELLELTDDLPVDAAPSADTRRHHHLPGFRSASFRMHLNVYVLVMVMLIGIWAMSGAGHFWPLYPATGWGIGLAAHYMAAADLERRRRRRRRRHRHSTRRPPALPSSTRRPSDRSSRQRPPGSSRAFVVAMFVDVVGSTGLNEAMGDEQWARERVRFRTLVQQCAVAEGGWEVSAAGDGVLTRFEVPAAAVRAATALQRALADRRAASFAPSVRIGIHSGDVIDEGDDIVGSVINVASRVGDVAGSDEILVTEHVADHIDDVVTTDRGLHQLKGVSQPRHLLGVLWQPRD